MVEFSAKTIPNHWKRSIFTLSLYLLWTDVSNQPIYSSKIILDAHRWNLSFSPSVQRFWVVHRTSPTYDSWCKSTPSSSISLSWWRCTAPISTSGRFLRSKMKNSSSNYSMNLNTSFILKQMKPFLLMPLSYSSKTWIKYIPNHLNHSKTHTKDHLMLKYSYKDTSWIISSMYSTKKSH